MSVYNFNQIFSLGTTRLIIQPGATLALLVDMSARDNYTYLKYGSGSSLEIYGVNNGVTATAAELVTAQGNHYLMGTTESIPLPGPARFYLISGGATSVAYLIRGRGPNLGASAMLGV